MHNFSFDIDPDISRASTPPSDVYNDPRIYEIVKERIFARSWQFVGHVDNVHQAQQVHPFTMLEGCLDEPLLLTRDKSEKIHCLSNVCTHRGMIVCDKPTKESFLRCRYHGRRFMLDGSFSSMPEFEDTKNFPSDSDHLPHVTLEQWGPFLFANLNPTISFDEWINPVHERMSWLNLDKFKFDASSNLHEKCPSKWRWNLSKRMNWLR